MDAARNAAPPTMRSGYERCGPNVIPEAYKDDPNQCAEVRPGVSETSPLHLRGARLLERQSFLSSSSVAASARPDFIIKPCLSQSLPFTSSGGNGIARGQCGKDQSAPHSLDANL